MHDQRGERLHRCRTHAVESGEALVAKPEKAQHRHHPVDGAQELLGRILITGDKALAKRQEVEQKLDQGCSGFG